MRGRGRCRRRCFISPPSAPCRKPHTACWTAWCDLFLQLLSPDSLSRQACQMLLLLQRCCCSSPSSFFPCPGGKLVRQQRLLLRQLCFLGSAAAAAAVAPLPPCAADMPYTNAVNACCKCAHVCIGSSDEWLQTCTHPPRTPDTHTHRHRPRKPLHTFCSLFSRLFQCLATVGRAWSSS